jgi:hypothetical protein
MQFAFIFVIFLSLAGIILTIWDLFEAATPHATRAVVSIIVALGVIAWLLYIWLKLSKIKPPAAGGGG